MVCTAEAGGSIRCCVKEIICNSEDPDVGDTDDCGYSSTEPCEYNSALLKDERRT
jgi:hypothetical protein